MKNIPFTRFPALRSRVIFLTMNTNNMYQFLLLLSLFVAPSCVFAHPANAPESKVVTGSVLLDQKTPLDAKGLLAALKTDWKIKTDSANIGDKTIVFSAPGATIMIAYLDYPVAPAEIKAAAQISWLWTKAAAEAGRHQAQVVISVISSNGKMLEAYKLFTKVAACVLEQRTASGVYMNNQYLLVPKGFYTAAAHNLSTNQVLPVYCWVYFGIQQEKDKSGGYTYGLQEFGAKEMEIANSKHQMQDVQAALYDAALYVIQSNVVITNGQSIPVSGDQKITVRLSKAVYIDGETWKLDF